MNYFIVITHLSNSFRILAYSDISDSSESNIVGAVGDRIKNVSANSKVFAGKLAKRPQLQPLLRGNTGDAVLQRQNPLWAKFPGIL